LFQDPQHIGTQIGKVLEIPAYGIFVIVLFDKAMGWVFKLRGRNGGSKGTEAAKAAFERPEFVKHDLKVDKLCEAITKLCNSDVTKGQTLSDILSSSKRQEEILAGIREDYQNGGRR
jgi:hypothetical protein